MIFSVEIQRTQIFKADIEAESRAEVESIAREQLPLLRPETEDCEILAEVCPHA